MEAEAAQFAEEVVAAENVALLETINQLNRLTVFAPVDGAWGRGQRGLMQAAGS